MMTTTSIPDEYLDLVDENDQVIGKKKRSEIYAESLFNYRVINAFVVNSKRKIWIPRRHSNKKYCSSCLDVSIGGHVESGENYEQALTREAIEELNINITQFPNRLLGHLRPQKDKVSSFMNVYEIQMDEIPNYNKNDFIEYFVLEPKAIYEKIVNGDKAKSDLLRLIELFYL